MPLKKIIIAVLILAVVAGLGYSLYITIKSGAANSGVVSCPNETECILTAHIHAYIPIMICGSYYRLPTEVGPLTGPHTHEEKNIAHWHDKLPYDKATQKITNADPLKLGAFFDAINVHFDATSIHDKKNGDSCSDGTKGTVKVFINGTLDTNPREYIWRNHDIIRIFFDGRSVEDVQKEVSENPLDFPTLGRG